MSDTQDVTKKRLFGKGVYGSKDVPIRILDGMIVGVIVLAVLLVFIFSSNGGYQVTFDTDGGSAVENQKLRHGERIVEPETPIKAGYEFVGWVTSEDPYLAKEWNFAEDKVEEEVNLYAVWKAASVKVILDANGGVFVDGTSEQFIEVTFGESYGKMEVPVKENASFYGWEYSGNIITEESLVGTNGEHILKARWEDTHE